LERYSNLVKQVLLLKQQPATGRSEMHIRAFGILVPPHLPLTPTLFTNKVLLVLNINGQLMEKMLAQDIL